MSLSSFIWGWLIFGAVLALLELVIPGAVMGFLGAAALIVAGMLHLGWIEGWVEALISWFISSLVLILALRNFALKLMPGDAITHNTDEDLDAQGSLVEVIETIRPEKEGRIRFRESTWVALSDQVLEPGEQAQVVSRDGNRWVVKSVN